MSIKETKLLKWRVETPELQANVIKSNFIPTDPHQLKNGNYLPIYDVTDRNGGQWSYIEKEKPLLTSESGVGNIAFRYAEICSDGEHKIPQHAKITKILQPMRNTQGDVTLSTPCYMVLFASATGSTEKVFLGHSLNKNTQTISETTLTWYFDQIGFSNGEEQWDKLYVSLVEVPYKHNPDTGIPELDNNWNYIEEDFDVAYTNNPNWQGLPTVSYIPTISNGNKTYNRIKLGCRGKANNNDLCRLLQSNKEQSESGAFVRYTPALTICYTQSDTQPDIVPHKDNTQVHMTPSQKTSLMSVKDQFKDLRDFLRGEAKYVKNHDVLKIFNTTSTNAARVHAWQMDCTDYVGEYFTQLTIYRPDPPSWTAQDLLKDTPRQLSIQVLDQNSEIITHFFSTNKAMQSADNIETTWLFDNIKILPEYKKFRFRGTKEDNVVQIPTANKTHPIYCKTINGNWGVIDQDNNVLANKTMNFTFKTCILEHSYLGHTENKEIHVTPQEKESLKQIEEIKNNNNTLEGELSELETNIQTLSTNLDNHKGNDNIHLNETQKNTLNNVNSSLTEINSSIAELKTFKTDVERLLQTRDEFFTTQFDGTEAPNNGKSSARCIQLSSAHFTSGVIKEIEIPYFGGQSATGYLCVQIFFENETNDTIKQLEECYFSINTQTQTGNGSCVYQFDNLVIPTKYKFIRLMIVPNKETAPNIKENVDSCPEFRMRCLSKDSSFTFDDDDCLIWTGSQNQTNYLSLVNCIKVLSPLNELNNIISIINELQSEIATLRSELDELKNNSTI